MIQTDSNNNSLKAIREREKREQETKLREMCEALVNEKIGVEEVKKLSNRSKGLWFLQVMDEIGEEIQTLALMKPIDRHILSYASTKINDDGLYAFLEQCMRECFVASIEPDGTVSYDADNAKIIVDDEFFIPAAMKFNGVIEGKKAALLKR